MYTQKMAFVGFQNEGLTQIITMLFTMDIKVNEPLTPRSHSFTNCPLNYPKKPVRLRVRKRLGKLKRPHDRLRAQIIKICFRSEHTPATSAQVTSAIGNTMSK